MLRVVEKDSGTSRVTVPPMVVVIEAVAELIARSTLPPNEGRVEE